MSVSFFWLLVATLVVWRITHLVQAEDGPWNIIVKLRGLAGNSMLGELMDCYYCLSLWVAAPVAYAMASSWPERLWLWPALSGAAILLDRLTQRPPTPIIGAELGDQRCRAAARVVAGPVTGRRYVFAMTGARVTLDARDREIARTFVNLRVVSTP
jgi:hypothetical protein